MSDERDAELARLRERETYLTQQSAGLATAIDAREAEIDRLRAELSQAQATIAEPFAWAVMAFGRAQKLVVRADVADELASEWRRSDPKAEALPLYAAPPPAAAQAQEHKTAWLVERASASGAQYACVLGGFLDWTGDHAAALRLSRRQDADAVASIMDDATRVAEHRWHFAEQPQPAADEPARDAVDAARADERERMCVAIKAADDEASENGYMLDSDDCISVIRGTWNPRWLTHNTIAADAAKGE